jgi:hypothetical protein
MSDHEPEQHEEIARRLRDEAGAKAPAELAGDVMRRVRSEPRPSPRRRPLLALLAAAVIIAALVGGISRLGGGSSSSASGGSVGEHASSSAPRTAAGDGAARNSIVVSGVPLSNLKRVLKDAYLPHSSYGIIAADRCPGNAIYSLGVPGSSWDSVRARLQSSAAALSAAPRVTVRLRRLEPGSTPGAITVTCP